MTLRERPTLCCTPRPDRASQEFDVMRQRRRTDPRACLDSLVAATCRPAGLKRQSTSGLAGVVLGSN